MYKKSLNFHRAQEAGHAEIVVCRITNSAGLRIFSDRMPPANIRMDPLANLYDGTYTYNGEITYGSGYEDILDYGGRVISWGELRETLTPDSDDLILSQRTQEISTMRIVLNNADKYFSKLLGRENMISAVVELLVGFKNISRLDWLEQITGRVSRITLTPEKLTLNLRAV
ncbi:MAG: hypothetical protein JRC93_12710 [Deltaproteobacteria bacterium]|nr:hypothetical protein [Deltaproteobacteria bacterium]